LRVWPIWERLARRIWLTIPVDGATYGIFAMHLTRYHGTPFLLPDGTCIRAGDRVAELHVNGDVIVRLGSGGKWTLMTAATADLRAISAWTTRTPNAADVKAFYAITLLASATKRLGFTLRERPVNLLARLDRFFQAGLLALYSEAGFDRLSRGSTYGTFPREAWISRAELVRLYGYSSGR